MNAWKNIKNQLEHKTLIIMTKYFVRLLYPYITKDISSKQLVIFIVSVVHIDFLSKELCLMSFLFTWNQSIVQQLISEGNWRSLFLNASPIGLNAMMMWRFSRTLFTKKANMAKGEKSSPPLPSASIWACMAGRILWENNDKCFK